MSTLESYEYQTTTIETFDLQARIFCPVGTSCNHPSEAALIDAYYRAVNEMPPTTCARSRSATPPARAWSSA